MKSPEEKAGELYVLMRQEVATGLFQSGLLAKHIQWILKVENGTKLYQRRKVPGCELVEVSSFREYLLAKPHQGLGFHSLYQIDCLLRGMDKEGAEAIKLLKQEIPSYDEEVGLGEVRARGEQEDAGKRPRGGNNNPYGCKGKPKGINDNNIIIDKERDSPAGTPREKGLRELRQKAPELHSKVLAGELTVHAACLQAGFRKWLFPRRLRS